MSSLLVIDTPRSCNNCGINRICEHADYNEYDERPSGCPLIVIPEPHGRLIDENNVINAIHKRMEELQENLVFKRKHGDVDLLGVKPYITEIPTIIEAEGKNDFQTENSYRELF